MIEVFITNITKVYQVKNVIERISKNFLGLQIDYDLDETGLVFPCGHTVLRIEGNKIESELITILVNQLGFECKIMPDTICL
ncbi:hypothetical protein [Flavobacterium sp. J27]|uniref:hypothetical protein n=1 Tax=Flavobacterium sp. J27 TaxID=2060419 RepID=UPI0010300F6B|nr:hypothetical protein [Flavobacterium sp. J27]